MNIAKLVDDAFEIGMLQHREEVLGLTAFLAAIKPYNVLEIGSWKGGLFHILCKLCPDEALKVSIDLDAYGDLDCTMDQRNEEMRSWAPNVHTIIGDSHDPATLDRVKAVLKEGQMFDFVLIDGDHSYGGCRLDWEMYRPLCCGWVAFHDIVDSERHRAGGCYVSQVWQEISRPWPHPTWEISLGKEWGGVGLVRV